MVFLFRALKLKVVNFLFIVGSNPPPECSDLIKYPRYEPDTCHCDLIKEELGGEFSQCILDPPKESSGLLRPISTSSYVFFISLYKINSFSFDSHRILCMTFEFWKKKKKGFAKNFDNLNVYSMILLYIIWVYIVFDIWIDVIISIQFWSFSKQFENS